MMERVGIGTPCRLAPDQCLSVPAALRGQCPCGVHVDVFNVVRDRRIVYGVNRYKINKTVQYRVMFWQI